MSGDIIFHIDGHMNQSNLNGGNHITFEGSGDSDTCNSRDDDKVGEKASRKNCRFFSAPLKSVLFLMLFILLFAVIFFALAISLNTVFGFGITDNGIVLAFVGILATFVVVSNYMQVKEVKDAFDKQVKENEKKFSAIKKEFDDFKVLSESVVNDKFLTSYNIITSANCHAFTESRQWNVAANFWILLVKNPYIKEDSHIDEKYADNLTDILMTIIGMHGGNRLSIQEKIEVAIINRLERLEKYSVKASELCKSLKNIERGNTNPVLWQ